MKSVTATELKGCEQQPAGEFGTQADSSGGCMKQLPVPDAGTAHPIGILEVCAILSTHQIKLSLCSSRLTNEATEKRLETAMCSAVQQSHRH
jgi:hypothetical protein